MSENNVEMHHTILGYLAEQSDLYGPPTIPSR